MHGTTAGLKVLVVDDEPTVRDSMRHLLEGLGCDAVVTPGMDAALAETESWQPELALVDYRLAGGEDGLEAIEQLRQRYPGLPAYLVTGDVTAEQFRAAGEAGVEILNKPNVDIKAMDYLMFKHLAFIMHNCAKVWIFALRCRPVTLC